MSRKFSCLLLAVSTLFCSLAVAYAAQRHTRNAAYQQAAAVLNEAGVITYASTALTDGRGIALAAELGLLDQQEDLPLSQLGVQALQARQTQQRSAEEAAQAQAQRNAYLALYDGVLLESPLTLYTNADSNSAAVRTLHAGKVAQLLDITDNGWYLVSFGNSTGYVPSDSCRGVTYADYDGSAATRDLVAELIDYAYTYLGTPYVYGGTGYGGIDCSGFTMRCFEYVGYSLAHGARYQYQNSTLVSVAQRDVGDLVFFSGPDSSGIEHVGIYLGNGRFIHASSSKGVTIDSIYGGYFSTYYYGAGRIIFE